MMELKRARFLRALAPQILLFCAFASVPLASDILPIGNDRSFVREVQMEKGSLRSLATGDRRILEIGGGRAKSMELQNTELVLKLPRKRQNIPGAMEVLGPGTFKREANQDRCKLTFEANLGAVLKNRTYDADTLNLAALRHGSPDAAFLSLEGCDIGDGFLFSDVVDIALINCGNDLNIRPVHEAKMIPVLRIGTDGQTPKNLFRRALFRSVPETDPNAWTGVWLQDGNDWYYTFSLPAFVEVAEPADVDSDLPDLLDRLIPETEAQDRMLAFFIGIKNTPAFLPTLRTLTRSCRTEDEVIIDELLRTMVHGGEDIFTVLDPHADYLKHISFRPICGYLAEKSVKDLGMHSFYYGGQLTVREWHPLRPWAVSASIGYVQVRPDYVGDIIYYSFEGNQRHCLFSCDARYDGRRFLGEFYALGDYVFSAYTRRGIEGHYFSADTHFWGCRSAALVGYAHAFSRGKPSLRSRSIPLLMIAKIGLGYSGLFQRPVQEESDDVEIDAAYSVRRGRRRSNDLFLTALLSLEKSVDLNGKLLQINLRGGFERDIFRRWKQAQDRLAEIDYRATQWQRPRNHSRVGLDLRYQLNRRAAFLLGASETFSSNILRNYSLNGSLNYEF